MTDGNGQSSLDTWQKLFAETMQPNAQAEAWNDMLDRLWQAGGTTAPDPAAFGQMYAQMWQDGWLNPARAWANYAEWVGRSTQIWAAATLKMWQPGANVAPVVQSESGDKRFSAPDWQQNAIFDALKQSYLLTATMLLKTVAETHGLTPHQQHQLRFYMRQFVDAISPTNFAFTNPQVIHEALNTGGQSLVKGTQNLLRDMAAGKIKMTDADAFTPGRNLALTPGKVVYRNQLIELIQYAPATEKVYATPLLFVPPWINKYYILDMQPQNSLIKYLVDAGLTVFVVSWKNADATMDALGFDSYLELGPLSAIRVVKEITGAPQVNATGYCIGGTLLSMALPYLAATDDDSVGAATFLVSLQDFAETGDTAVFIDETQVANIERTMAHKGYLDSSAMAAMFNMLRANDLIWSNVVNNYLLGKESPAFDLLYWNDDGTRMTRAAHSFYLRNTYLENNLVKPGKIVLRGVPIDLSRITQDIYAVGTQQDHIVPWQSAWRIGKLASGKTRFILGGSGHIAGIIQHPNKGRGYWTNDNHVANADEWFAGAEKHSGSWWPDWTAWLAARSGEKVVPPTMGSADHSPIADAPGTYVLEK